MGSDERVMAERGAHGGESVGNFPAGMRVLVVDDDPVCLVLLQRMLKQCSYEVTVCGRATAALTMLRERKDSFDLVISDVHMPDMDGFRLLELVGLEMDLPVIMMSANGDTTNVMKGIIHGACDYLLKPVRVEELRNIWQHVVRRRAPSAKKSNHPAEEHSGSLDDSDPKRKRDKDNEEEINSMVGATERDGESIAHSKRLSGSPGKKSAGDSASASLGVFQGMAAMNSAKTPALEAEDAAGASYSGKKRKDMKGEEEANEEDDRDASTGLKKSRVVWSPELHQQFVNSVNQLGVDKAVPKRILEIMNVQGLTRENVASHLQKYRLYLKRLSSSSENPEKEKSMPQYGLRVMNPMHQKQLQLVEKNKIQEKQNVPSTLETPSENQKLSDQNQIVVNKPEYLLPIHQSLRFPDYSQLQSDPNRTTLIDNREFQNDVELQVRQISSQLQANSNQMANFNQQRAQNLQIQNLNQHLFLDPLNKSLNSTLGPSLDPSRFPSSAVNVSEPGLLSSQLGGNLPLIHNLQGVSNPSMFQLSTSIGEMPQYPVRLLNQSIDNSEQQPIDPSRISNSLDGNNSLLRNLYLVQNQQSQLQTNVSNDANELLLNSHNNLVSNNLYQSGVANMGNAPDILRSIPFKLNDSDTLDAMINSRSYREAIGSSFPPNAFPSNEVPTSQTESRKDSGTNPEELLSNPSFPLRSLPQFNSQPSVLSPRNRLPGIQEAFQNSSNNLNSQYGTALPPFQNITRSQNFSQNQSQNQSNNASDSPHLTGNSTNNADGSSQEGSAGFRPQVPPVSQPASQFDGSNHWKASNLGINKNLQSIDHSIRNTEMNSSVSNSNSLMGKYYRHGEENDYHGGSSGDRDDLAGEDDRGRGSIMDTLEMKGRVLGSQDRMNSEDIFRSLLRQESDLPEFTKLESSSNEGWIDSRG